MMLPFAVLAGLLLTVPIARSAVPVIIAPWSVVSGTRTQEADARVGTARAVDRSDPRPAVEDIPLPPGMAMPTKGRTPAPSAADLPRNGFVTGRFTAQGQWVDYTFEAEAGELSLFDLGTWGYARSWSSVAGIRILAADDTPLVIEERGGETAYRSFLRFVAPRTGVYRYRLSAQEEMFRYTLVRHSDYAPDDGTPKRFGERSEVHGALGDAGDSRTFVLDLVDGEEVALRVANDHPTARKQKDNVRRRAPGAAPASGGRGARDGGAQDGGAQDADFPDLVLQVLRDGEPVSDAGHFVLFTPQQGGTHQVVVTATSAGEGGLFVVELERAPPRVSVSGYIGDEEDDPVPGITLRFFREPSSDEVGAVTSDERGEFTMSVLPGTYSVHVRAEGGGPTEIVQANIDQERELNLVWVR